MKNTPIERGFYSFDKLRAGDFLIFVGKRKHDYEFLYIPGPDPFYLSNEDFDKAIETGVLSFVEQLPKDIFKETINFSLPSPKQITYTANS
jgi:hypothetical protein